VLFGSASAFGLHLLAQCALKVGIPSSFRRVTEVALPGDHWSTFIDAGVCVWAGLGFPRAIRR
jgi:hypothetical protein